MSIAGTDGMTPQQIQQELAQGGRFVVFPYCISLVVITFKRNSAIHFLRDGEGSFGKALPYMALSFFFGWWGLPWGIIYTFQSLAQSASGGVVVTPPLMTRGPG